MKAIRFDLFDALRPETYTSTQTTNQYLNLTSKVCAIEQDAFSKHWSTMTELEQVVEDSLWKCML